jgi:hypothetical protein
MRKNIVIQSKGIGQMDFPYPYNEILYRKKIMT